MVQQARAEGTTSMTESADPTPGASIPPGTDIPAGADILPNVETAPAADASPGAEAPPAIEEPPGIDTPIGSLIEANRLESLGNAAEAIALCEKALDGTEFPDHYFTLARNYFGLAHTGDETFAWKALLAALEGIDQRAKQAGQTDVEFAIGIVRWALEHFADWSRLDVTSSYLRSFIADEEAGKERGATMEAMLREHRRLLEDDDAMMLANTLYRESPLVVRPGRPEESVVRESLFALANQFSQHPGSDVGKHLEGKGFPVPGGYNFQVYDKYLYTSSRAELLRLKSRARGVPAVMIACMPKSASEFLAYTMAEVLSASIVRASIGDPLQGVIVEDWVREIMKGGCVLHDHFGGRAENLAALRNCGVTELFVLVRDPRAVAFSMRNMGEELGVSELIAYILPELGRSAEPAAEPDADPSRVEPERDSRDDEAARRQAPNFALGVRNLSHWIESWVDAEKQGFRVKFVTFSELVSRPMDVMGDILDQSGAGAYRERLSEVLAARGRGSNFRSGDDNAWRKRIPPVVAEDAWLCIPVSVRERLGLVP
jgi:hypothetical protein